ncbi:MAG: flavodoxin domain-containing protein [Armatimonadota bacterium]|nr:flavodoxin domain-containing protein [Armatimonadota bacterium]
MSKVTIIYDSRTGHTEKMAHAVAAGVLGGGVEAIVKRVDYATSDDLLTSDGVVLGSPCCYGQMSWKMKKFLDDNVHIWGKIDGKIGAAFVSGTAIGGGCELTAMSLLTGLISFGFLVFGVTEFISDELAVHYGAIALQEPRGGELKACRRLGEKMAEYVLQQAFAPVAS